MLIIDKRNPEVFHVVLYLKIYLDDFLVVDQGKIHVLHLEQTVLKVDLHDILKLGSVLFQKTHYRLVLGLLGKEPNALHVL